MAGGTRPDGARPIRSEMLKRYLRGNPQLRWQGADGFRLAAPERAEPSTGSSFPPPHCFANEVGLTVAALLYACVHDQNCEG